jgi:hypothetical protein
MICPKCGSQQEEGTECLRCGVVFARFRKVDSSPILNEKKNRKTSLLYRCYRIFRWLCLAGLIFALFLIFRNTSPPLVDMAPNASDKADEKMREFMSSADKGSAAKITMNEAELNGWIETHIDLQGTGASRPQTLGSAISLAKKAAAPQNLSDSEVEQLRSSIRDVKVELEDDSVHIYALFDLHGLDLSMELEGKLLVDDGYLRMEPTAGRLGSLPLPSPALNTIAGRIFDSPQNKEKFKLPSYIQDVRVENSSLTVTSK